VTNSPHPGQFNPYEQAGQQPLPNSRPDPFFVDTGASVPQLGQPQYGQQQYGQQQYGQPQYGQPQYGFGPNAQAPTPYGQPAYNSRTTPIVVPPIPGVEPPLNRPWYGIGFLTAFARAFRKYATFSGRASRGEFWWFFLAEQLLVVALVIGWSLTGGLDSWAELVVYDPYGYYGTPSGPELSDMGAGAIFFVAMMLYSLASLIPRLALTWRRLHDAGHSGAWFFISWLPGGVIVLLVFLIQGSSWAGAAYDRPAFN
jgi:uncharacterized membrane protein YhaH (DUF805 family)